eukprot:gene20740-38588_t
MGATPLTASPQRHFASSIAGQKKGGGFAYHQDQVSARLFSQQVEPCLGKVYGPYPRVMAHVTALFRRHDADRTSAQAGRGGLTRAQFRGFAADARRACGMSPDAAAADAHFEPASGGMVLAGDVVAAFRRLYHPDRRRRAEAHTVARFLATARARGWVRMSAREAAALSEDAELRRALFFHRDACATHLHTGPVVALRGQRRAPPARGHAARSRLPAQSERRAFLKLLTDTWEAKPGGILEELADNLSIPDTEHPTLDIYSLLHRAVHATTQQLLRDCYEEYLSLR